MALPPFLDSQPIQENCRWAGLDADIEAILQATAQRIAADPALRAQAEEGWRRLYYEEGWEEALPLGPAARTAASRLAAALVLREAHRARVIPEPITHDTGGYIGRAIHRYRLAYGGQVGIASWLLFWHRLLASGELYRLKRLEFVPETFECDLRVTLETCRESFQQAAAFFPRFYPDRPRRRLPLSVLAAESAVGEDAPARIQPAPLSAGA